MPCTLEVFHSLYYSCTSNQPLLKILIFLFLFWESSPVFFFIYCKDYSPKKLHKIISTLSNKWELKKCFLLWCFCFVFREMSKFYIHKNICFKMYFWCLLKTVLIRRCVIAWSLQREVHYIEHERMIPLAFRC